MYTHQMVNRRTGEQVEQEQKTNKFYGYETHQIESAACVCVGVCLCVQFFVASSKHFTILPKDLMMFLCWCLFDWFALWSIWIFNRFTRNIAQSWCIIAMCPRSHNQLSIQTKCIFIWFFFYCLVVCSDSQQTDWSSRVRRFFFLSFSECLVCAFEQIIIYHLQEKRYNAHWNSNSNKNKDKYIRKKSGKCGWMCFLIKFSINSFIFVFKSNAH